MENITEVLILIDRAFWKHQAMKTCFFKTELATLVYIFILSLLSTQGHIGMSWMKVFINHSAIIFGGGLCLTFNQNFQLL